MTSEELRDCGDSVWAGEAVDCGTAAIRVDLQPRVRRPAGERDDLGNALLASARGDEAAFRLLVDASRGPLMAMLLRLLERRDWAEDVLQDSYLKIWQRAASYDARRGRGMPWLLTVARHQAIDFLRSRPPEDPLPDIDGESGWSGPIDAGDDPYRRAEEAEGLRNLRAGLRGLPEKMRKCLLLSHYAGYTHLEVAELLQVPLGTVKTWVKRGADGLRAQFSDPEAALEHQSAPTD